MKKGGIGKPSKPFPNRSIFQVKNFTEGRENKVVKNFAGSMISTVRDSLASAKRADRGRGHDADRPDLQRAVADLRSEVNSELNFSPTFEGLVLGCIDADFCK